MSNELIIWKHWQRCHLLSYNYS